jgi:hypothetical protein
VDSPAFVAQPDYIDLLTKEKLTVKDVFVARLTHSAYFIQTLRIKPKYNTRLEKLLTIFEQANFVSGSSTTKFYTPEVEDPEFLEITNILQYVAGDSQTREELDKEEYYLRYVKHTFGDKDKAIADRDRKLMKKDEVIAEKDEALAEKDKKFRDIVYSLKCDGMQIEKIATLTGLTISEIEAL